MSGVFISYSHDSDDPTHAKRVAGLAASLLQGGLEVYFDQNRGDEEEGLPWDIWMEDKILEADHVLLVCTELYHKKVRQKVAANEGRGVCWEARIIYSLLYQVKWNTTKFVSVIFSRADEAFIPLPLNGKQSFVIDAQSGYNRLYAFLTGQHRPHFPNRSLAIQTLAPETIEPLFALPAKPAQADLHSTLYPSVALANPRLALKPDYPPQPRQDIRGLDWYDECDASHFLGRDDDANRIVAMLVSHPILRLVGASGIGKSSLVRAGLLPKIREFGWRACVIRPFEDPARRVPRQLTAELLIGSSAFGTPLDPTKFRAEVTPLLSSKAINRLVLFLDQFEDIVSPLAVPGALDAMREFLQELWQQKEIKPYLRAVAVYRTDADVRLGRLWQEISGKSEGLPYFALQGLSRDATEQIVNQTVRERGWRLETSVPEIVRQLALESEKLDCSGEIFPVYLQMFLKQAEQNTEGRITAEFMQNLGGVSGLISKYLEQALTKLKARGGEWGKCDAVLESLCRSSGAKTAQSLNDLVRETGMSRDVLAAMLQELINERLVRPIGHETYEIQHDRLAAALIDSMKDSDRESKEAREFLGAKVRVFERSLAPLDPRELVYLYRHRQKINPTEPELKVILASFLQYFALGAGTKSPGAFWFRTASPQNFLRWFIHIEHWAAKEPSSLRPSHEWVNALPLSGLESQFAALVGDPAPSIRAICAQLIGREQRREDLPLLRELAKDQAQSVRIRVVTALASFAQTEALPLLRQLARDQDSSVRAEAVTVLANYAQAEDLLLLRRLANDENEDVRLNAVNGLRSYTQSEALQVLRELAKNQHFDVRVEVATALASFAQTEVLPLLRQLARDQDSSVRAKAATALASFAQAEGSPLVREVLIMLPELNKKDAVRVLGSLALPDAMPVLRHLAKDQDSSVRAEAVKVLASFAQAEGSPLANESLFLLRELVENDGFYIRAHAARALASFAQTEALPLLRQLARDQDSSVRAEAVTVLANYAQAEDLLLLRRLARDQDVGVRAEAVMALANRAEAEDLLLLRQLARDQDSGVRAEAVMALANRAEAEDLLLLHQLALDSDKDAAVAAITALARHCSSEEMEVFLNQHDQELCAEALTVLDEILYMPEWMKEKKEKGGFRRPPRIWSGAIRLPGNKPWSWPNSL